MKNPRGNWLRFPPKRDPMATCNVDDQADVPSGGTRQATSEPGGLWAEEGVMKCEKDNPMKREDSSFTGSAMGTRRRSRGFVGLTRLTAISLVAGLGSVSATLLPAPSASADSVPGISAPPDVVVAEADGTVTLPVTLSAPTAATVTVNYTTADGSASGGNNSCVFASSSYEGKSGTLTFTPGGALTDNVVVTLLNCHQSLPTGFMNFYLKLSGNSVGSTITRVVTQVDITGDAAAASTPGLFVKDAVVDAGAGNVSVPVVLGGPSGAAEAVAVTVPYTTNNGSALAGTDYTTTSGTLTFPPGETAQDITVPILERSGSAHSRSFSVTLGTPTNATVADGTGIVTMGASGASAVALPGISAPADTVVGEADGYIDLPVTLSAPGEATVTVNYTTADGSASGGNNSCPFASSSYEGQSGTLTFTPGVTTQVVRVPLLNCHQLIPLTFTLNLSSATNGTIARAGSTITIVVNPNIPAPKIKAFSPSKGQVGKKVTIKGSNLENATSVHFNGVTAVITKDTATKITTKVPVGATTGVVTVTTDGGIATSSKSFTVT